MCCWGEVGGCLVKPEMQLLGKLRAVLEEYHGYIGPAFLQLCLCSLDEYSRAETVSH
jgi:hypothetical protein